MLKSIKLAGLLVRLARASRPTYYEVGPSYHQELDIANGQGSARIIKVRNKKYILYKPYNSKEKMLLISPRKALQLNEATTYKEILALEEVW
jgi:hypothetical protein